MKKIRKQKVHSKVIWVKAFGYKEEYIQQWWNSVKHLPYNVYYRKFTIKTDKPLDYGALI